MQILEQYLNLILNSTQPIYYFKNFNFLSLKTYSLYLLIFLHEQWLKYICIILQIFKSYMLTNVLTRYLI